MKDKKKHSEEKIEKVDAEETASAKTVSEESLDEKELNAHQTIMNLIQMANDRFNQELEKIYSL